MRVAILSDIHGNICALKSVISDMGVRKISKCILLGDLIDYGMHSNEVIKLIKEAEIDIICNIYGNHEDAIVHGNYGRFSSERGVNSAKYTASMLSKESVDYIKTSMDEHGYKEIQCDGKTILCIHGSINDPFWKSISAEKQLEDYSKYDYVLSGHSHIPHFFEQYWSVESPNTRNKKKVVFINPGSVGQPRNINCLSQYCVFDTETEETSFFKIKYDVEKEMSAFNGQTDDFYRDRLRYGV